MSDYFRPIPQSDSARPADALTIAGGWTWFTHAEHLRRDSAPRIIAARDLPEAALAAITTPRKPVCAQDFTRPAVMGILNATPDSFSDGGLHHQASAALAHARRMIDEGADIIDIGGESTRPGALEVPVEAEIARVLPLLTAVRAMTDAVVSIDTRKAEVARAAVGVGAALVNDVSGLTFDPELAPFCMSAGVPVCIMHARGDPETMQDNPRYDNVLLDVYDFLSAQVLMLAEAGVARDRIIVDPGIGFGKTVPHNLALLNRISLFHSLGCPILLGASRKGFIRTIAKAMDPVARAPGSIAVALAGVAQGVQILRVHDVGETVQALALDRAVRKGEFDGA